MAVKAVQQIQLGTVMGTEEQALKTMRLMKEAGYDGIELNGFMIKKMPPIVKILTKMAGMPVGNGGKLDWKKLMGQSGLSVVSVHEDLGSIKRAPEEIIAEAESFGTHYVVITGMHMFDYSDGEAVKTLAEDLNTAGKRLKEGGISLLYHNHNCEFLRVTPDMTAYEYIIENTDPEYLYSTQQEMILAEVCYPRSVQELYVFLKSTYLRRAVRFKECRLCGKLFAATDGDRTEYCSREYEKGKTCREVGASRVYQKKLLGNPITRAYNRAYKTHNARIRYGTMTREEFNAWTEEAKKHRDACQAGEISLERFEEWLKQ